MVTKFFKFILDFLLSISILLAIYKWQSILLILDTQYRWAIYFLTFYGVKENPVHIHFFAHADYDRINWDQLSQFFNLFATSLLMVNIILFLYIRRKEFYTPFDFSFEVMRKNHICSVLVILLFFLFLKDLYFMYSILWNYVFVLEIKFSHYIWGTILDSFNHRMFLIYCYKILIIYVSFFSKNETIIKRVLIWTLLWYLLRSSDLLSTLLFDASVWYFLAAFPNFQLIEKLNGGFFLYFDSFVASCSGEEERIQKEKKCNEEFAHFAFRCGTKSYSLGEKLNGYLNPNTQTAMEISKKIEAGKCIEDYSKILVNCLEKAKKN